jgi:chromosomal replication initiator protein
MQKEMENERDMFWSALEDVTCSVLGVPSQALYSTTRKREIVTARQIIFFIIRPCYVLSLKNVGDRYKKDHATILHGINQASAQVEWDKYYRANVERICFLLNEIGYAKPMSFFNKFVDHVEHQKELKAKRKSKIK